MNDTHFIDNVYCEWIPNDIFANIPSEIEIKAESSDERIVYSLPFGMTQQDIELQLHVDTIYVKNPNNPDELILDIDTMMQVQQILDKCDYVQKLESVESHGEILMAVLM